MSAHRCRAQKGVAETLQEKAVAYFIFLHDRHIELENSQLLPLAVQLLSNQALSEMGNKMADRRGIARV